MGDTVTEAGSSQLENAIKKAASTLNSAFGEGVSLGGSETYEYLRLDDLAEAYKNEALNGKLVDDFIEISKSIKRMRSSYLPVEFFKDNSIDSISSSIVDTIGDKESFENTFMRMLGMPSSEHLYDAAGIYYIDSSGAILNDAEIEDIERNILDERQKEQGLRRVVINNSIYNLHDLTPEFLDIIKEAEKSENGAALISESLDSSEYSNMVSEQARFDNLENDLFKFCYLLLPAVQDARVSGCINETDKIVASPFSPVRGRMVNQSKIKPPLLESIIRIRMDRLSGTSTFTLSSGDSKTDSTSSLSVSVSTGEEGESLEINPNSYGILESLMILRLNSAIVGLARQMSEDTEALIRAFENTRKIPIESDPTDATSNELSQDDRGMTPRDAKPGGDNSDADISESMELLSNQLLIEDAIMALLVDNTEALDLQTQTQRTSSIHDSHIMSGLVGIVNMPRKKILKEIDFRTEVRARRDDIDGGEKAARINTMMGVSNGIGVIDIAVFSLALFTMSEEGLLGLLSEKDYENMISNDFSALPASEIIRKSMLDSVNEYTALVRAGYMRFQDELKRRDQIAIESYDRTVLA